MPKLTDDSQKSMGPSLKEMIAAQKAGEELTWPQAARSEDEIDNDLRKLRREWATQINMQKKALDTTPDAIVTEDGIKLGVVAEETAGTTAAETAAVSPASNHHDIFWQAVVSQ